MNMGAWTFIEPRCRNQLGINLHCVSRPSYGPPATGIGNVHRDEVNKLLTNTFQ
jgi:2-oxoglutarate dehydrogenase complex dehydrogenase (E1) component-like enzyme